MLDIDTVSNRLTIRKLAASNVGAEYVAWLNDPLVRSSTLCALISCVPDGSCFISWGAALWLHGDGVEEIEGLLLMEVGFGGHGEGGAGGGVGAGVAGDGGEVVEESVEGACGRAVVQRAGLCLSGGFTGPGCGCDGVTIVAGRLVFEGEGCEGAFHVPADVVGEHAEEEVGGDAVFASVVDGSDVQVNAFHGEEGLSWLAVRLESFEGCLLETPFRRLEWC